MSGPLLTISEARRRRELRRAVANAQPVITRRVLVLAAVCFAWMVCGWGLLGLSFNLTDSDGAGAAFLAGLLLANGGPAWTLILSEWHHQQG